MTSTEQFQAYAHVNNGEYQYWQRVGEPQESEARAWLEIHSVGIQFWPENAPRRRLFESRCKVDPVYHIPIR